MSAPLGTFASMFVVLGVFFLLFGIGMALTAWQYSTWRKIQRYNRMNRRALRHLKAAERAFSKRQMANGSDAWDWTELACREQERYVGARRRLRFHRPLTLESV